MSNPYSKYKATAVQSASKEKILLMLYEAAIKFTKKAIIACEAKDIAERGLNIGRAYDIVSELNNTLNHKLAPEMCKNMEQLYMFVTDKLIKANISGDVQHLKEALKILEILNDGWIQAIEKLKKEGKTSQSA
ncbi:MAG: flagellar export chaperone FliS [Bdellovibrionota bacterium]